MTNLAFKAIIIGVILAILTGLFPGNIIQTIGIPIDNIYTFMPVVADGMNFFFGVTDLVFIPGTGFLLLSVLAYWLFVWVNIFIVRLILMALL